MIHGIKLINIFIDNLSFYYFLDKKNVEFFYQTKNITRGKFKLQLVKVPEFCTSVSGVFAQSSDYYNCLTLRDKLRLQKYLPKNIAYFLFVDLKENKLEGTRLNDKTILETIFQHVSNFQPLDKEYINIFAIYFELTVLLIIKTKDNTRIQKVGHQDKECICIVYYQEENKYFYVLINGEKSIENYEKLYNHLQTNPINLDEDSRNYITKKVVIDYTPEIQEFDERSDEVHYNLLNRL